MSSMYLVSMFEFWWFWDGIHSSECLEVGLAEVSLAFNYNQIGTKRLQSGDKFAIKKLDLEQ